MAKAHLKVTLDVSDAGANAFSGGPYWSATLSNLMTLADGRTANEFDLAYVSERTVADGANDDIDLAGVLSTAIGDAFDAAEVVAVLVINKQKDDTENTTSLTIGGGSNPWVGWVGAGGDTVGPIGPGGMFLIASPDASGVGAVVAGTGDILRVANSAGAANTYQIAILARSA